MSHLSRVAEQIVELYGKLGSNIPAAALWGTLFITPELETRADKIWETYKLSEEPRLMFQRIVSRARNTKNVALARRLLKQVKGTKISEPALGIVHSCAIDVLGEELDCVMLNLEILTVLCAVASAKYDEALEQLNEAVKDVSLENINATCLQRLQQGLTTSGKQFPYTIPPKV